MNAKISLNIYSFVHMKIVNDWQINRYRREFLEFCVYKKHKTMNEVLFG